MVGLAGMLLLFRLGTNDRTASKELIAALKGGARGTERAESRSSAAEETA